ncbi:hypothetical protein AS594_40055 [Streptomyces agglomeratus]|uniref:Uncharacterized protein n=1 Tax=Streptomyces agglomeratus TaxID=285458 RepID=A0A1E5NXJ7_9ACTN|nr:hypothetical protein [Streptomyces agglomeratus]OEJ20982.1 hypothetical protein AS594_40055 [Streptomyces agglomeratus]
MASSDEQGQGAGLEPVGRVHAVRLTEQLRAAIGEARRAAVVLAQRVRDAHRARVWVALGYGGGVSTRRPSWGSAGRRRTG